MRDPDKRIKQDRQSGLANDPEFHEVESYDFLIQPDPEHIVAAAGQDLWYEAGWAADQPEPECPLGAMVADLDDPELVVCFGVLTENYAAAFARACEAEQVPFALEAPDATPTGRLSIRLLVSEIRGL